jgi:Domain of unknown function (DUF4329)
VSQQRERFEAELRQAQPNWEAAIDNLNALAMSEMLPALAGLTPGLRSQVLSQTRSILGARGWAASVDRIEFAIDVVNDRAIRSWPSSVPSTQVDEAMDFIVNLLHPASAASRSAFSSTDDAAITAIRQINPASVAINREFAGSIFRRGTGFGFTAPVRGGARDSDPNVPVPAGSVAVGMYHTHGNGIHNGGAEVFSADDVIMCRRLARFSYLGTPAGRIKKLTPRELMSAAEQEQNPLGVFQQLLR